MVLLHLLVGPTPPETLIFEIFFFPPDIPARPVFFPGADIKWSSMGAWLPLFSMVGVFAFVKAKKKNWISRLLKTCLVMAFVPILNSAFCGEAWCPGKLGSRGSPGMILTAGLVKALPGHAPRHLCPQMTHEAIPRHLSGP